LQVWGPDVVIGIASRYGLDGRVIPVKATVSAIIQVGPRPTQPPVQWVPGLFPGVKAAGAGRVSYTSSPLLGPRGLFYGEFTLTWFAQMQL
jgi:hypothetical protein